MNPAIKGDKMKTILFLLLAALLISSAATAKVLISEVIADPIGTDSGGEAVELYNTEGFPVDISGLYIATESSSHDATMPNGSVIPAYGFYLIADSGWSSLKDNSSWPNADYEEAMIISNSDAGVALMKGNETLDAVGWGNPANISAGFYEGTPLTNPKQGQSFERKPGKLMPYSGNYIDTGDNSADFIIRENPEPQNSMSASEEQTPAGSIELSFSVDKQPAIISLELADENPSKPGIQVIPVPGGEKALLIRINSSKNTSFCGRIQSGSIERNFSFYLENGSIISNFSMHYHDAPGNYTAYARACSSSEEASITFEYEPLIALSVDSPKILLPQLPAGSSFEIIGDYDTATEGKPTLSNIGNRNISTSIFSGGFSGANSSLGPEIAGFAFSEIPEGLQALSQEPKEGPMLFPEEKAPLTLRLTIPAGSIKGNYSGTIMITARGR
ncbi:hypothetical protein COT07_04000 [Candidatus Woesearchaeota archaeon CG07_land_8_20_14_0_80_44_23]|nr:MAG: hypothetical protein COT07_04000 [Candidatus Woesearchaeota archaeon CG07_land_8_20_14_0_80_44_23]